MKNQDENTTIATPNFTPITDNKSQNLLRTPVTNTNRFASMCDFARTLEKEINQLKEENQKLKGLLKAYEL